MNIKEAFEKEQRELDNLKKELDNSIRMKKDWKKEESQVHKDLSSELKNKNDDKIKFLEEKIQQKMMILESAKLLHKHAEIHSFHDCRIFRAGFSFIVDEEFSRAIGLD